MRTPSVSIFIGLLIAASPTLAARDRSIVRPPSSNQAVQEHMKGIVVKNPVDGEALEPGTALTIVFTTSGLDTTLEGKVLMMAELLKDGTSLGPAHNLSVPLFQRANVQTQSIGVSAGKHLSGSSLVSAASGGGYRYRVSLYTGDWKATPTIIMSGLSGTFSLGVKPERVGIPVVTVTRPVVGASYKLGAGENVTFQVKNSDPSMHGRLKYAVELVHNASNLGTTHDPRASLLPRLGGANNRLDVTVGSYVDAKASLKRTAPPGSTYQYRVTVYTGEWTKSPTVVASGLSAPFTLKRYRPRIQP